MKQTFKRAEILQIIKSQGKKEESDAMLALLLQVESIINKAQRHIRKGKRQLPAAAVAALHALQEKTAPHGFNHLVWRLIQRGSKPKDGTLAALGKTQAAQEIVFQHTQAYRLAFEREKGRLKAKKHKPP